MLKEMIGIINKTKNMENGRNIELWDQKIPVLG